MEKDKKYNVVLGLMIFFFLVIVGVSIAWGLGYIGIKNNNITNENINASDEDTVLNKEEETNKSDTTFSISEIKKLNKEYVTLYEKAIHRDDACGRVEELMKYYTEEEMQEHIIDTSDEEWVGTDIDYTVFINKLNVFSKELIQTLCTYGGTELFKEVDGKLYIFPGGWSGCGFEFLSQELVSNNESEYVWKVIGNYIRFDDTDSVTYNVKGRVENSKYVLVSVEEVQE